jgi:putative ABC transport system permease protein
MDTLRQDINYACRRLFRSPGFTAVAVVTLALGIGANSAIFSVVNAVLLRPLPYAEPERLVGLHHFSEGTISSMSGPNFTDLRAMSKTMVDAAVYTRSRVILTGQGEPVRLDGARVSAGIFNVLGVPPILGRTFNADENQPGRNNVTILSYGLWQQRFGGDKKIVGRNITLDGISIQVVGVMPKGFSYPANRVLWMPIEYTKEFTTTQRASWYLTGVGRARPGISIAQVIAEVRGIGEQLAAQYPDQNEGVGLAAVPLHEDTVGNIRKAVLVLLGAVGLVLLIACTNVANLLLARAAAREGEMAVRSALGAGRGRLVRQLMTESLILGIVGGGLGLLLAVWGVDALISLEPQGIARLSEVRIDRGVVLFTIGLSLVTGMLFGIVPAFQATRTSMAGTLKEMGRGTVSTRGGARVRGALVIAEMALAVMLLTGAGLLVRSFTRLASVDPGFRAAQALTFELSLPDSRYDEEPRQIAFFQQLLPRLRALPGVESVAGVTSLPLTGASFVLSFQVDGRPRLPTSQQPAMDVRVTTPDYFQTMGISLKRGRFFTADDRLGSPQVVVITESAVRHYFPTEDPLGKKIVLGWGRGKDKPRAGGVVVGIVGDVKDSGLDEADPPELYLPFDQWPVQGMSLIMKTSVPPASLGEAARRTVYAVDSNMPVANVRTLEQIVARSISQPKFYMTLLAVFAAVALVLAAIGIFGVLSYAVAQRTREIGIRMALGAQQRSVLTLIVMQAMMLAVAGVAIGTVCALVLSRSLVATLLFSTSPHDAVTFVVVAALLAVVALASSYIPARRATRVDPIVTLRAE